MQWYSKEIVFLLILNCFGYAQRCNQDEARSSPGFVSASYHCQEWALGLQKVLQILESEQVNQMFT